MSTNEAGLRGDLTHFDESGRARMVAIDAKPETPRFAEAFARVHMHAQTLERIGAGSLGKGDVLAVARVAGISAAKRSADLIPLCHPVRITQVEIDLELAPELGCVLVRARVHAMDRTGPEMEALSAASVAALTIYDMCKAVDRGITIEQLCLLRKSGGKSGDFVREGASGPPR